MRLPTLKNKRRLAWQLLENGRDSEAVRLLDDALQEQRFAPWSARWRNWRRSRMAHRLLVEAEQAENVKEVPPAISDRVEQNAPADRPGS